MNILLLEDDLPLGDAITIALEKDGNEITRAASMFEALDAIHVNSFSLMLLDIGLPDGSGLTVCRKAREKSDVPIIFLTANDTESDMLEGFRAGCDDYIAKPFSVNVLRQKVLALLKRSAKPDTGELDFGELLVDINKMRVTLSGEEVTLSATQFKILEYMINNRGKVLTRGMLIENIWDVDGEFVDENTLSVQIKRLRSKLESDPKNPQYIKTVFGIGYTFGKE